MTAQRDPASASAARIVGARSHFGSFIITSVPVSVSNRKLPQIPWTDGGAPVTIDRLLGLVKVGTTASATSAVPCASVRRIQGMTPAATAWAM